MNHALLLSSLGLLGTGPLVARLARSRPAVLTFIDGFVLVSIGGLVLLDVVPHALVESDALALLVMAAGFALPSMAERLLSFGVRQTHFVVMVLAMLGVAMHSVLDGSALAQSASGDGGLLGFGVVLHQLPVSLMVWWVLSDRARAVPFMVLALMAGMTLVGYFAEPAMFALLPERASMLFEALVGGSLLHVVVHPAHDHDPAHEHEPGHPHVQTHVHAHDHHHDHEHSHAHDHAHTHAPTSSIPLPAPWVNGLGAVVGALLLAILHASRAGTDAMVAVETTWRTFWALCLDSAPAVLLAYITAGVVYAWLPAGSMAWLSRGSRLRQGFAGMAVGLPLPICSCGVVPLYQQLVQQGASTTAAVAFLVATPELGIDAILLSVPLLGTQFAIVRVVAAAAAAITVALIMGRLIRQSRRALPLLAEQKPAATTTRDKLARAAESGLGEMVDHTAPWILVGLVVAAIAAPVLTGSWITSMPPGLDVLVFAMVGLPLYICASASTPLVAVLVAAGVSPGAGLALLLTGPATNVATIGILTRMHGKRFAWAFSLSMMAVAVVLGLLVNALLPSLPSTQPAIDSTPDGTPLQLLAVLTVGALYLASVLRNGIRGFLSELSLSEGA
ncbi:permease [Gemmatimonas sp.]